MSGVLDFLNKVAAQKKAEKMQSVVKHAVTQPPYVPPPEKRPRGRPRKGELVMTPAERQRAYRLRKKQAG